MEAALVDVGRNDVDLVARLAQQPRTPRRSGCQQEAHGANDTLGDVTPARHCAARALGNALRRQPLSDAKIRFAWTASVGAAMARATTVRLRSDGALLVRAASDEWRRATYRSRGMIRERLAALLGTGLVKRLEVTSEGAEHHASSGHRQRRTAADRQVSRSAEGSAGDGSRIAGRP
ncbi:MAG: DUF721 domain-containing protein [Acidobacteria bacterium]|nr:DUF721 domain-containing protein [Acidobacteriota bacterium]MYH28014.1 DUF721 domain-containing protein [Acidobacteriota bacterium]